MKTKKLIVYETKKSGSFMLCPTQSNFKQKDAKKFGKAVGKGISNAKLGRLVREMMTQCD